MISAESRNAAPLLAFCAGSAVNAAQLKHDNLKGERLPHSRALGTALSLDMAQWFRESSMSSRMRSLRKTHSTLFVLPGFPANSLRRMTLTRRNISPYVAKTAH